MARKSVQIAPKPWVVLMMKAPEPGEVKTRLAAEIGDARATALYRSFVERTVRTLSGKGERDWRSVIAYTPAKAGDSIRQWLAPLLDSTALFIAQPEGNLGVRLESAFARGFDEGAPSVLALGADCLDVAPEEIRGCLHDLEASPVTIGEALDGGYWVIGMSGRHFELFRDMPWSTPELCKDTRRRAAEMGLAIAEQGVKSDIDTMADLRSLDASTLAELGLNPLED